MKGMRIIRSFIFWVLQIKVSTSKYSDGEGNEYNQYREWAFNIHIPLYKKKSSVFNTFEERLGEKK